MFFCGVGLSKVTKVLLVVFLRYVGFWWWFVCVCVCVCCAVCGHIIV